MTSTARKTSLLALFAIAASVPLAAVAAAPRPAVSRSQAEAPVVAPIPFRERRLKNGLRVLTAIDRTTPNVTVQVWYGVGSKDDPKGRSGFAHLFEHMMFKATRDMAAEHLDRITEDVGGENNASTADDFTDYYELIPANHLDVLLWAEAERMSSLKVDQANFLSERDVVKEELRQRVLADPYGRFFRLAIPINSYAVHPYKRPGIGSIHDLDASTLADVKNFHDTYYRPDNATLVVVGNFDQASLDALIDKDFGAIQNPAAPRPHVTVTEPPRTGGPRVVDAYGPTVPLPAVAMTWLIPEAKSPDLAPLRVLDAILTTGKSSRLYADLVYKRQSAQQVFSNADQSAQPGLFYVGAVMTDGYAPGEGETAILADLAALRTRPVGPEELSRAKNQILAGELQGRETILGRGVELGQAVVLEGDPARANTDIAEIMAVTPADVMRVVDTYLGDDKRVTVRYRAETARPKDQPPTSDDAALDAIGQPLATGAVAPPPPAGLATVEPEPTAPVAAVTPAMAERTLRNGLRVIVARTAAAPLVTAELTARAGAVTDAKAGESAMMASLLTEGAGGRSAEEIAAEVEAAGGSLAAASGYDSTHVVLTVLSKEFAHTLPIMADVVQRPTLSAEELERKRAQKLNALQVALQQPGSIAGMVAERVVFGAGEYGQIAGGTPATVKSLTRDEVLGAYKADFQPANAILVITGDIAPENAFTLAEKNFGAWQAGGAAPARPPLAPRGASVTVVDLPGAGQAAVTIAAPSIKRSDLDYYRVEVANGVLGGGYSARLNEEVRVKRGLSYGAGSNVAERADAGIFTASAQTKNESAVEVADLLMSEAKKLGAEPIAPSELESRKAALIGGFGRAVETSAGLANLLTEYALYGVPLGEIGRFTERTSAVTPAEAKAAALEAVDPARASLIIVGDARLFADRLKARYPNAVVIPAAELDLDRPELTKNLH